MESKCEKVIIRLMGGLGNQMFQYAAGRSFANKWNAALEVDISLLNRRENSELEINRSFELSTLFTGPFPKANKLTCSRLYPESNSFFDKVLSKGIRALTPGELHIQHKHEFILPAQPCHKIVGLVGRFQCQYYFERIESDIRESFRFKQNLPEDARWIKDMANRENSVAIHVRRGDYVSHPVYSRTLGFVGETYIQKAMKTMEKLIGKKPNFIVVTDDHAWCEKFFGTEVTILKESFLPNSAHSDFVVLTQFKNLIISNSTFGWWAAKLAEPRAKHIIAPRRWAAPGEYDPNILPSEWIPV